jgi:hypothetical protein
LKQDPNWRDGLNIEFIGKKSRTAVKCLESFKHLGVLSATDQLSKTNAIDRMCRADGLLLLSDERLARYLPGKLFDYIASRVPILIYGAEGEATRVVKKLNAGYCCRDGDVAGLSLALRALRDRLPRSIESEEWLNGHRRDSLAGEFFQLLNSLSIASARSQ